MEFFSTPPEVDDRFTPPPPRERPVMRHTRWKATPTTWSPWVKVPLTYVLLIRPIVVIIRMLAEGKLPTGGPEAAVALFFVPPYLILMGYLTKAMWIPGKVDAR